MSLIIFFISTIIYFITQYSMLEKYSKRTPDLMLYFILGSIYFTINVATQISINMEATKIEREFKNPEGYLTASEDQASDVICHLHPLHLPLRLPDQNQPRFRICLELPSDNLHPQRPDRSVLLSGLPFRDSGFHFLSHPMF